MFYFMSLLLKEFMGRKVCLGPSTLDYISFNKGKTFQFE